MKKVRHFSLSITNGAKNNQRNEHSRSRIWLWCAWSDGETTSRAVNWWRPRRAHRSCGSCRILHPASQSRRWTAPGLVSHSGRRAGWRVSPTASPCPAWEQQKVRDTSNTGLSFISFGLIHWIDRIYTTIAALYANICPQNLTKIDPCAPNSTAIIA